jgi:hypothetical protein
MGFTFRGGVHLETAMRFHGDRREDGRHLEGEAHLLKKELLWLKNHPYRKNWLRLGNL